MKRKYIPLWKALKEARENDDRLTDEDGICARYDVENCGCAKIM